MRQLFLIHWLATQISIHLNVCYFLAQQSIYCQWCQTTVVSKTLSYKIVLYIFLVIMASSQRTASNMHRIVRIGIMEIEEDIGSSVCKSLLWIALHCTRQKIRIEATCSTGASYKYRKISVCKELCNSLTKGLQTDGFRLMSVFQATRFF